MNPHETAENIMLFFGPIYIAIPIVIGYAVHVLINNPDIQQKLQSEIDSSLPAPTDDDYLRRVSEIKYLEWFIREVFRMYPTATIGDLNRSCVENTTVNEIAMPKGYYAPVFYV